MKKQLAKNISVAMVMIVIMATLLSCSRTSEAEKFAADVKKSNIRQEVEAMNNEADLFAKMVKEEQDFYSDQSDVSDYESFQSRLSKPFDEYVNDFEAHRLSTVDKLKSFKEKYQSDEVILQIERMFDYVNKLSSAYEALYHYHNMVVEFQSLFKDFNNTVTKMMNYMTDGNVTSNEYNRRLEEVMADHATLLNANSLLVFDTDHLGTKEEMQGVLEETKKAKAEILAIETNIETDKTINQMVYDMFDYMGQLVEVIYNYSLEMDKPQGEKDSSVKLEKDAKAYFDAFIESLDNPFNEVKE